MSGLLRRSAPPNDEPVDYPASLPDLIRQSMPGIRSLCFTVRLAATPRNIGGPERKARQLTPGDFYE